MSLRNSFLVAHASPPMPGMPLEVSAATIVVHAKPDRDAQPGEQIGSDRRQHRVPEQLAAAGAEHQGGVDAFGPHRRDPGDRPRARSAGTRRGTAATPSSAVVDPEPDDQQAEVAERREAAQEPDDRFGDELERAPHPEIASPSGTPITIAQHDAPARSATGWPRGAARGSSRSRPRTPSWVVTDWMKACQTLGGGEEERRPDVEQRARPPDREHQGRGRHAPDEVAGGTPRRSRLHPPFDPSDPLALGRLPLPAIRSRLGGRGVVGRDRRRHRAGAQARRSGRGGWCIAMVVVQRGSSPRRVTRWITRCCAPKSPTTACWVVRLSQNPTSPVRQW